MNKKNKLFHIIPVLLIPFLFLFSMNYSGCSGISDTVENAKRLQFKLGSVDGFNIAGVKLKNVSSISNLNITDGAKLLAAFAGGNMQSSFTVNLIAKNPDYAGGSKENSSLIKGLDWRLLIDDNEVLTGAIDKTIEIPGVGKQVTIPIPVKIDFMKLLGNGGYESLINLALAIGGKSGNSSKLTLKIKPTIDTFLGGITYPGEIDVVSKEFR
ncbi:MAG: LEA type 2 family protein [Ignavibacteria bacterium]|nr:LEA type 2 family protein [Ignavibacteria bacterium]